jgi:hypothetical protein
MASAAGESKNINRKLDVEVYCDPKVMMGLGIAARIGDQIYDLGKATLSYSGDFASGC